MPNALSRWIKVSEAPLSSTRIFDLKAARYRHPEKNRERDFYVINSRDWVNVVALTKELELVLVKQFRFGIDTFSLEIPGGVMENGEDPVAAGLRELREETGYEGKNARLLGKIHPNPAILSNALHVVYVEECVRTAELEWDADEEIEISTAPVAEVLEAGRDGRICHSLVLNALYLFEPLWQARVNRKTPGTV